jgi:acyl carrier protein
MAPTPPALATPRETRGVARVSSAARKVGAPRWPPHPSAARGTGAGAKDVMSSSVATVADRTVEDEVLDVVGALAGELGIEPPGGAVSPAHSLDRDLGLGSLERVELALRLEQALGVALADEVMAVDSVADLARAARTAGARPAETLSIAPVGPARGGAAAAFARTLTEALAWHADRDPDRVHVRLHEDGREELITYGGLWRGASAIARGFHERLVAKREVVRWPIVGTVIAGAKHLTVDRADVSRSVADAARVTAALEAGDRVLVFPEGTFRREHRLLPFRLEVDGYEFLLDRTAAACCIRPIARRPRQLVQVGRHRFSKRRRVRPAAGALVISRPPRPSPESCHLDPRGASR